MVGRLARSGFSRARHWCSNHHDPWLPLEVPATISQLTACLNWKSSSRSAWKWPNSPQYENKSWPCALQICLANNVLHNLSLLFSKLSVLCFYHRILSISKTLRRIILAVGVVVASNCVAAVAGLIFAFSPVNGQWNLKVPSHSIHSKAFWVSIGIINLFLDLGILAIPQSKVWKLNLSTKHRIGLSTVFLLGGL